MKNKLKIALPIGILAVAALLVWYLPAHNVAVLNVAGPVSRQERNLLYFALLLSAVVVIPVFAMTIGIVWKYRENGSGSHKQYRPEWDHSRLYEGLWWGIPAVIIGVLSVVTWNSSHALDPYKPLAATVPALNVDVVALDWKWLFIYPAQNIASVNELELPVGTPVDFNITSDSVMNSFWIPNLGGQIYAMPGMNTQLHLEADKLGTFPGSSANISGSGFAGMKFKVRSVPSESFQAWVAGARRSPLSLSTRRYAILAEPSSNYPVTYYRSVASGLYQGIIDKYMLPAAPTSGLSGSNASPVKTLNMAGM